MPLPLTFEIYDRGRRLTSYVPRATGVMGPESVPTAGRVGFEQGLLRVDPAAGAAEPDYGHGPSGDPDVGLAEASDGPATQAAAGVSLLWDAGEVGCFVLETCRLPPRKKPYILNVELARHRIMRLVHKQEDWNLWTPETAPSGAAGESLRMVRRAQEQFAEALGLLHDPPAAATKADEALSTAIAAGEGMARAHAEATLLARKRAGSVPKTMFGVRADPAIKNAKYRGTLARFFDYATVPMPWGQLQPEEELFDTAATDSTVEFLHRNRVPTIAGPLVDFAEGQVPEWLFIYEHDFESLRDLAFEYVKSVVTRYRRVVRLWNVTAGLHAPGSFSLSFEQMIELTRLLVNQVKAVIPQAKTVVTARLPFGEHLAASGAAAGVPSLLYAEMVAQSGVDCDAIGLELQIGMPRRGEFCRDLFQISSALDRFSALGKPLFVTSIACPDRERSSAGAKDPADAGRWHGPWSPDRQAKWLRTVYRLAMSKPFVENLAWSDLSDFDAARTSLPGSGLLDDMLRPKPAFEAVQELRRALRPPSAQPAPAKNA